MRNANLTCSSFAIALLFALACAAAVEPPDSLPDRHGLRCISRSDFPVPADAKVVPLPAADFETGGKTPPGWGLGGGQIVVADDAPQGKVFGACSLLTCRSASGQVDPFSRLSATATTADRVGGGGR